MEKKVSKEQILVWAHNRELIDFNKRFAQTLKLQEEVGELAKAILTNDKERQKDGIGDAVIVLTILAKQLDLDIQECVDYAFNEIKNRKGKIINNTFVKNEDLKENESKISEKNVSKSFNNPALFEQFNLLWFSGTFSYPLVNSNIYFDNMYKLGLSCYITHIKGVYLTEYWKGVNYKEKGIILLVDSNNNIEKKIPYESVKNHNKNETRNLINNLTTK